MMKALITGGAGFLGSHMVDHLLSKNFEVVVLDNLSSGLKDNLSSGKHVQFIEGDVLDRSTLQIAGQDCDIIFHFAAKHPNTVGHVIQYSALEPADDAHSTIVGAINVLEQARIKDSKVVYISTAAVYGNPPPQPLSESHPVNAVSQYGLSKYVGEQYCTFYRTQYGIPVNIMRIFNTYGPRQRKYVMFDILNKLKINSKRLELLGDPNDKRDFIYVTDAIRAIYLAVEHPNNHGTTINIGTGQATSIDHVVQNICEILGLNPIITYTGNSWQGNVQIFYSDPSKLMSYDWKSSYTLNAGLKLLTSWYENTFGKIK